MFVATLTYLTTADQLDLKYLKPIQDVTYDVRNKWNPFGLQLDLNPASLSAIDKQFRGDLSECFRAILEMWLLKDKVSPSFPTLLTALRSPSVGYGGLARTIEKMSHEEKQKIGFNL